MSTATKPPDESSSSSGPHAATRIALSATYHGPTSKPFVVREVLPSAALHPSEEQQQQSQLSLEDKTKFLRELRSAVSAVQEQVNKELTARMNEDKARDATAASADEVKEEENYGEELPEEEEDA